MGEDIHLQKIIKIIRKRLVLIISLMLMAIGIAIVLNLYVLTPIYHAQTQILVNQKSNNQEATSWDKTESDLSLINTYHVIMKSPAILNKVIEKLKLDVDAERLAQQLTISNESNSKVINIEVLDENAVRAVEIANTIAAVFKDENPNLLSVDNINILSAATVSENPSPVKPNAFLNMMVALFFSLLVGIGLAFLLETLDTTVKSERDIEEILELPILGLVGAITHKKESRVPFKSRRVRRTKNVRVEK